MKHGGGSCENDAGWWMDFSRYIRQFIAYLLLIEYENSYRNWVMENHRRTLVKFKLNVCMLTRYTHIPLIFLYLLSLLLLLIFVLLCRHLCRI